MSSYSTKMILVKAKIGHSMNDESLNLTSEMGMERRGRGMKVSPNISVGKALGKPMA